MARHSVASLAAKLFATAGGFIFAVFVARLLGPRGYGIVAVVISVITIAATLSLFGANGLAIRETATLRARSDWSQLRRFIKWSSAAAFLTSLALGALVAAATFVAGPYRDALLLGAFIVPLLAGLLLLRGITQGAGRIVAAQIPIDVIRWALMLGLILVLILRESKTSPTQILLVVLLSYAVALLVAGRILTGFLASVPRGGAAPVAHRWIWKSLPFLGIALFGIVGTEINTLLLGWLIGPREAGLYQPLAKLAPLMMLAREAIEMPLAPRIVQAWERGARAELQRIIQRSALACTMATAGIAITILATSTYIFAAFGPEFAEYQGYLCWIAAAQVVNAATGSSHLLLSMAGNMKRQFQAQTVTLAVQVGLGFALVPLMGVAGAVFSLTAAIITWSVLHWIVAWRATGIDTSAIGAIRFLDRPKR